MKIAALVVTYERKAMLSDCLTSILWQKGENKADIIVIDNNSSDGTSELFLTSDGVFHRQDIHYFNTGMNTGCAGGFTFGIRKAAELGYDFVWLMDDDCIPADSALEELVKFSKSCGGEFGFLSSMVLWKGGGICEMNIQRATVFRPVRSFEDEVIPVKMASFASLFIPMKVIRDVGLPYREFFIWTDDWEYTRRISKKYDCFLIPSSEVTHFIKSGSKADIVASTTERLERYHYLYRNDVFLYRKEGFRGFVYESVRIPFLIMRVAFSKHDMKEKIKRAGIVVKGTFEGLSFYPAPERLPTKEDRRN